MNIADLNSAVKFALREDQAENLPGTMVFTLRVVQNKPHPIISHLTLIDIGLEESSLIVELFKGNKSESNSPYYDVLDEVMTDNFKLVILSNCSPHISAAEIAKKTMELTTSFALVRKQVASIETARVVSFL